MSSHSVCAYCIALAWAEEKEPRPTLGKQLSLQLNSNHLLSKLNKFLIWCTNAKTPRKLVNVCIALITNIYPEHTKVSNNKIPQPCYYADADVGKTHILASYYVASTTYWYLQLLPPSHNIRSFFKLYCGTKGVIFTRSRPLNLSC